MTGFSTADIPDLTGRTAIVTGASSGIGLESRAKDGFELQFGTNHLGHFALTNLLVPVATQPLPGNTYAGPRNGLRGAPAPVARSKGAGDPEVARRLWQVSEQLTGVSCPEI